jgi:hypothetical protein
VQTPPYADGQDIHEGLIYRRIPPWGNAFDRVSQQATFLAFEPSQRDLKAGGISALLKEYVTEEEARTNPHNPEDRRFGLCLLDIAAIRIAAGGTAGVRYKPTARPLGHAHVQIYGCESVDVQQQLAVLAKVVRPPSVP